MKNINLSKAVAINQGFYDVFERAMDKKLKNEARRTVNKTLNIKLTNSILAEMDFPLYTQLKINTRP